jgi:hypothetical protein
MQWTVSGSGASQSGSGSTIVLRAWTISGSDSVAYMATIQPNGALSFNENSTSGIGTVTEQPPQVFIAGVLQRAQMTSSGSWHEHVDRFTIASPDPTTIMHTSSPTPAAAAAIYGLPPSGWSGTVNCTWSVTR